MTRPGGNGRHSAQQLEDMLTKHAAEVEAVGRWRWILTVPANGTALTGQARLEQGWLTLEASLGTARADQPASMLRLNEKLSGLARCARPSGGVAARVVADLPLAARFDLSTAIGHTLRGFAEASGARRPGDAGPADAQVDPDHDAAESLLQTCAETDWVSDAGRDDRLVVPLPARGGSFSAQGAVLRDGLARLWVDLVRCARRPSATSRHAIAGLLLTASESLRYSRPTFDETDSGLTARFEVRLPGSPTPSDIDRALCALTVACDLCGPEVELLARNEDLADAYLKARGHASAIAPGELQARRCTDVAATNPTKDR